MYLLLGLPGPPTSVRVSIVDNRPTISWAPYADGSGDIVGFKVEYREKSRMSTHTRTHTHTHETGTDKHKCNICKVANG